MIQDEARLLSNAIIIEHQLLNAPQLNRTPTQAQLNRLRLYREAASALAASKAKLTGTIDLGDYLHLPVTPFNEHPTEMPRPGDDCFPELYDLCCEVAQDCDSHPEMVPSPNSFASTPRRDHGGRRRHHRSQPQTHSNQQTDSHNIRRRAHSDPIPIKNAHLSLEHFQLVESPEIFWDNFHCGSPLPSPAPIRHYRPVYDLPSSSFEDESSCFNNPSQDDCEECFEMESDQKLYEHIITSIENIPGLLETADDRKESPLDKQYCDQTDSTYSKEETDPQDPSALSHEDNQKSQPSLAEIGATLRRISIDFMDSQTSLIPAAATEVAGLTTNGSSSLNSLTSGGSFRHVMPFMLNKTKMITAEVVRFHLELIMLTRRVFRRWLRSAILGLLNFSERVLPHLEDDEVD